MNIKYKINKTKHLDNIIVDSKILNEIISSYVRVESIDENSLNLVKISSGAYGKIYKIKNQEKKYILKKPIEDDRENQLASEVESKILSLFSAFQNQYLKKIGYFDNTISRITPKVYAIYNDKYTDMKNIIMEKLDGDMFDICRNMNLNVDDDCKLLIEMLYQVASHLYLLQKYFKFMHNDLKQNNILYKLKDKSLPISSKNVIFILTDFGGSTICFDNQIQKGSVKGNDLYYDQAKDIYLLVHMIITYIRDDYKRALLNFLKLIFDNIGLEDCNTENDNWHKLYEKDNYPKEYEPSNLLNKLHDMISNKNDNLFQFTEKDSVNTINIISNNKDKINKYSVNY